MEFSFEIFGKTMEALSSRPHSETVNRADNTSSYHDLLLWKIHPEILKSARGCRLSVLAISFLGLNPVQEYELKRQLSIIADKFNHEGEWNRVKDLLNTEPFTPARVLEEHLRDRGPEDYFGHDLRELKRIWFFGLKVYNPYAENKSRVKYPKRKRGYDDKGRLPETSYGAGNTTKAVPRPAKEPLKEISITNTSWFSDLQRKEENVEQGTLEENRSSRNPTKKSSFFS